jgi:hypothetical protein
VAAALRAPYRASARSWMSSVMPRASRCQGPQRTGEIRDGAVRFEDLHAGRDLLQQAAQLVQEEGIVA